jgi:hypothetical protein
LLIYWRVSVHFNAVNHEFPPVPALGLNPSWNLSTWVAFSEGIHKGYINDNTQVGSNITRDARGII